MPEKEKTQLPQKEYKKICLKLNVPTGRMLDIVRAINYLKTLRLRRPLYGFFRRRTSIKR